MSGRFLGLMAIAASITAGAVGAGAAPDVRLEGKRLVLKTEPASSTRRFIFKGKLDPRTAVSQALDSTGATLVIAGLECGAPGACTVGAPSHSFDLNAVYWHALGSAPSIRGYVYKDSDGTSGGIIKAVVTDRKVIVRAKGDAWPLVAVSPIGSVQIELFYGSVADDQLCAEFGGTVKRDQPGLLVVRNAPRPCICPDVLMDGTVSAPVTCAPGCGNGVVDPDEECDGDASAFPYACHPLSCTLCVANWQEDCWVHPCCDSNDFCETQLQPGQPNICVPKHVAGDRCGDAACVVGTGELCWAIDFLAEQASCIPFASNEPISCANQKFEIGLEPLHLEPAVNYFGSCRPVACSTSADCLGGGGCESETCCDLHGRSCSSTSACCGGLACNGPYEPTGAENSHPQPEVCGDPPYPCGADEDCMFDSDRCDGGLCCVESGGTCIYHEVGAGGSLQLPCCTGTSCNATTEVCE